MSNAETTSVGVLDKGETTVTDDAIETRWLVDGERTTSQGDDSDDTGDVGETGDTGDDAAEDAGDDSGDEAGADVGDSGDEGGGADA